MELITSICPKRPHGASAAPVTVYVLDEDVFRGALDCDAFIFITHFNVMYPYVVGPYIDAVETTSVTSTYDHIVDFTVGTCVYDEVECSRFLSSAPFVFLCRSLLTINKC